MKFADPASYPLLCAAHGRARKIATPPLRLFPLFLFPENAGTRADRWPSFLFSERLNVVTIPHPQRSFHDPIQEFFIFLSLVLLSSLSGISMPSRPTTARRRQGGRPQGRRHFSKFSRNAFFSAARVRPVQFARGGVHFADDLYVLAHSSSSLALRSRASCRDAREHTNRQRSERHRCCGTAPAHSGREKKRVPGKSLEKCRRLRTTSACGGAGCRP